MTIIKTTRLVCFFLFLPFFANGQTVKTLSVDEAIRLGLENSKQLKVSETKLGPEETTNDIPGISLNKLRDLDENGIVRI